MSNLNRILYGVFSYKKIGLFLPKVVFLVYFIPAIFGLMFFKDEYAYFFLKILFVTIGAYMVSYYVLSCSNFSIRNNKKITISTNFLIFFLGGGYLIFFLYTLVTAPHLAIIESLRGADSHEIAIAREEFLKARQGNEYILAYINAFMTAALIPYLITALYVSAHKWRHLIMGIFIFTLLVSLEKSLIIKAALPILVLVTNEENISNRSPLVKIKMICLIIGVILLTGFLANIKVDVDNQSTKQSKYYLFGGGSQASFLFNRVVWIPYVTAYDWLRYFDEGKNHQYLGGKTSLFVSSFLGEEQINMEREVFNYQWGQSSTGTGNANTGFFIEAYVNFGWMGVIGYSFIIALIAQIFSKTDNIAAKSVYYFYAVQLSWGSLPGVLLSNGLLILVFIALFIKVRGNQRVSAV